MNNVKEKIILLFKGDKKLAALVTVGSLAVLLILLSEVMPAKDSVKKSENKELSYTDYVSQLEKNTEELISSINGAGNCKVMITLKNSNEYIYAKNIDENSSSGSNSLKNEYVLYEGQEGEQPVLIKQYFPQIQGVAVVCEGASVTAVRESVINTVSSLFDIPVTKISVSEYKG